MRFLLMLTRFEIFKIKLILLPHLKLPSFASSLTLIDKLYVLWSIIIFILYSEGVHVSEKKLFGTVFVQF